MQIPPLPFAKDIETVPWEVDPGTGDKFVAIPDVCGPSWWAMLHAAAAAIRDAGCSHCGEFAVDGMVAFHDMVNFQLGKPIQDLANLDRFAHKYMQASDHPEFRQPKLGDPFEPGSTGGFVCVHGQGGQTKGVIVLPPQEPKWTVTTIKKGRPTKENDEPSEGFARSAVDSECRRLGIEPLKRVGMNQPFLGIIINGLGLGLGFAISNLLVGHAKARLAQGLVFSDAEELDVSGQGEFVKEIVRDSSRFDPESFRTVEEGNHRAIVACPKGRWSSQAQEGEQCQEAMELQAILHPREETADLVKDAIDHGVQIIGEDQDLQAVAEILERVEPLLKQLDSLEGVEEGVFEYA